MKIKVGDVVRIMVGRSMNEEKKAGDRGKEGKVIQVLPEIQAVVVEGVRKRTKHIKARGEAKGRTVEFFAPIPVANVAIVGKSGAGRVGFVQEGDKKTRVLRAKKKVETLS